MKKNALKLGGFIGLAAAVGYTVYTNVKKKTEEKQEQEIIDISPEKDEAVQEQ